jgi:hypothetical protein
MTSTIEEARDVRSCGAAGWLGLAASPSFGLMAWLTAHDPSPGMICSAATGDLPVGGMAWMYLLMSVFHLSPWLRLASLGPRRRTSPRSS